jgi:hypothetical protein
MRGVLVRRRMVDAIAFLFASAATLFGLFWLSGSCGRPPQTG